MAEQESLWRVERENARGRTQVVFEGLEHDARRFVAQNFPRVHVEPGSPSGDSAPDAWIVSPDGTREVHYGPEHDNEDYEPGFGPHPDDKHDTQESDATAPDGPPTFVE